MIFLNRERGRAWGTEELGGSLDAVQLLHQLCKSEASHIVKSGKQQRVVPATPNEATGPMTDDLRSL